MMNSRLSHVVIAALPLMLCHCDDGGANIKLKGLRDEIDQLSHQNYETQQQVDRLNSQIKAARTEKAKLEEEKAKVEAEREAANKKVDQLQRDFESYKAKYKLSMKTRAPGLNVADFTSADGKTYQHVVLREITDTHVNFTHDAGIMKLHYKMLPESLQDMLGYLIELKAPEPRDVSKLTAKQFNASLRSDRDERQTEVESKLKDLRAQKEQLTRNLNTARINQDSVVRNGGTGIKEGKLLEQFELANKQLDAEIMRIEVDLHKIRSETLKLKPIR